VPIYLDYNATTPVDPAVYQAMLPFLAEVYGNPSSSHAFGVTAAAAVTRARGQVAALLGCGPDEVVFTGCASESNNLAIKGTAFRLREKGRHIITTAVEHPAVLNTCRYLSQEFGFDVTVLPVGQDGRVTAAAVAEVLRPDTVLVSIMHAQNETGVLQPVAEIGRLCRERGVLFHVDAAQSVGKIPVHVDELGCDLLTVAGHKLYAPKGVGALYVRTGVQLHPLIHGAGYEGGRRAGTANVAFMVSLGEACDIALTHMGDWERVRALRDQLHARLAAGLDVVLNGHETERLPNTLNVCVPGVVGNDLLAAVPEVLASTGSACHAGVSKPSDVLLAMGVEPSLALGALRLSLGRYTTADDVEKAATQLVAAGRRCRQSEKVHTSDSR